MNLCMFVYAHTYISGFRNEKHVMCTYVSSLHTRAKLMTPGRQRDRQLLWTPPDKDQGIILYLFKRGQLGKSNITAYSVLIENKKIYSFNV